ncbi:Uncharacterised protein [Acinetobacter baumannii]|nr:Uncharacterised protein [Acinetobacter baumannii]
MTEMEKMTFCLMIRFIFLDNLTASAMRGRSFFIRTTSAVSKATSVPSPIAIPTDAVARAGASLMPSPTIATVPKCSLSFFTSVTFVSGRHSAIYASIWLSEAIALAVFSPSPVSMTVWMPSFLKASMAVTVSSRTTSFKVSIPAIPRSSLAYTIVLPCSANVSAMPFWNRSASLRPTKSAFPTCQSTPLMYA